MDDLENKKLTQDDVVAIIQEYMDNTGFTHRKITDTPTDDLMITPRKYVNANGITANRPISSITGQFYFDTTIGRPIYRKDNGTWVDGAGSVS